VPLAQSKPDRQRIAYADVAFDHLRIEDILPDLLPVWLDQPS